jgi:hypothetical protein
MLQSNENQKPNDSPSLDLFEVKIKLIQIASYIFPKKKRRKATRNMFQ